jgi:hypothetical protein
MPTNHGETLMAHTSFFQMTVTKKSNGRKLRLTFLDREVMLDAVSRLEQEFPSALEIEFDRCGSTIYRTTTKALDDIQFWL